MRNGRLCQDNANIRRLCQDFDARKSAACECRASSSVSSSQEWIKDRGGLPEISGKDTKSLEKKRDLQRVM